MAVYFGIPTINNLKYLKETIESIDLKDYRKILVINNASTDDTANWLQSSVKITDIITNKTNIGVAKSWNQIINWALSFNDCEALFILNNDIVLGNSTLDLLEEDLLISKYGGVSGVNIGNHPTMLASYGHPTYRYSPNINFSCFGLTPLTIKRVGFFDEGFELAYFEDNDYHHRMNLEGVSSVCDNWAPFIHYGSRSIKEGGVKHEPYFTNNREYFKKKWGFVP